MTCSVRMTYELDSVKRIKIAGRLLGNVTNCGIWVLGPYVLGVVLDPNDSEHLHQNSGRWP